MVSQNYRFFPGSTLIRELVTTEQIWRRPRRVRRILVRLGGKALSARHAARHGSGNGGASFRHGAGDVRGRTGRRLCARMAAARSQYAGGGGMEALFEMAGLHGEFPFTYSGSLIGKAPRTPWPGVWRIEFDKETVVVDSVDGRYGVYRAHADGFEWLGTMDGPTWASNSPLAHFIGCIRAGKEPWCSGRRQSRHAQDGARRGSIRPR